MYLLYLEEEETKMKVNNKIKEIAIKWLEEQYVAELRFCRENEDSKEYLPKAIDYLLNLAEGDLND